MVNVGHFFKVNYKTEFDSSRELWKSGGKSDDDVLDGIHFLIRQFYTDTH